MPATTQVPPVAPTPEPAAPASDADPDAPARPLIREPAPGKINLYLHVTGQYPNGYHSLDSLVVFTRLGDTVDVSPGGKRAGIRLTCDGPFAADLGAPDGNLVLRAARLLADRAGRNDEAVDIRLTKRLPVASGIGGGSADAAAAIRALARLWDLGGDPAMLFEIAQELGADVPMCLGCRARPVCAVGGIGDEIAPAPLLPPFHLLLVNPGVMQPTPAVFAAREGAFSEAAPLDRVPENAADLARELKRRTNDLTDAAIALTPDIRTAIDAVAATPDCLLARMSGSGATVFGSFETAGHAEIAAGQLRAAYPDWWVRATALL